MAIVQTNNKGRVAFPKGVNTNVRAGYSTGHQVIYQASPNYRLGVLTGKSWQIEGEWSWFEIVTPKNQMGWVRRDVFQVDLTKPIEEVPTVSSTPAATAPTRSAAPETYTGPAPVTTPETKTSNAGLDMAIIAVGAIVAYKFLGKKKRAKK